MLVEQYTIVNDVDAAFANSMNTGTPLVPGSVVYRVFVDMAPNYKLNMVFGGPGTTGGGSAPNRLDLTTTTSFWNFEANGVPDAPLASTLPLGAAFDSYFTIGTAGRSGGEAGCGVSTQMVGILKSEDPDGNTSLCSAFAAFPSGPVVADGQTAGTGTALTYNVSGAVDLGALTSSGGQLLVTNDAWAAMPNGTGVDPAGANRVLIAQLTTDGALSFHLNVQLQAPTGQLETYVWNTAAPGQTVHAALTYPRTQPVLLAPRLFLDGPYSGITGLMDDQLRIAGLVPASDPYPALGYTHVGTGSNGVLGTNVLARTGNNAIVDWVLVELRHATTPATILASRSALLQRDGDVVDTDGSSPVRFDVPGGEYHVAVRHRNHLGCMTGVPITLGGAVRGIDFTSPSAPTFGIQALKDAGTLMLLKAGDVTFNGRVQYTGPGNDRDPILVAIGSTTPNNVIAGYRREDVNMDGLVKYTGAGNDRDPILVTVGSTVPTSVVVVQVP